MEGSFEWSRGSLIIKSSVVTGCECACFIDSFIFRKTHDVLKPTTYSSCWRYLDILPFLGIKNSPSSCETWSHTDPSKSGLLPTSPRTCSHSAGTPKAVVCTDGCLQKWSSPCICCVFFCPILPMPLCW